MTEHRSRLVVITSDVHFPHHHRGAWAAFCEWVAVNRPYRIILNGDMIDFAALSRYDKSGDEALPSEEIALAAREINALAAHCERVTFVVGNHEDRFRRLLSGVPPHVLEGLRGLTLREQMRAHGLSERVEWFEERAGAPQLEVAQFVIRHGHKQAGRFGGGVNPAINRLNKSLGVSEVIGHHHVAQHAVRAAHGRVAHAIANPCMESPQNYAGSDATWAMGFTVLEVFPGWTYATPHLVVMNSHGAFAWGGRVYGLEAARREAKREDNRRTNKRRKRAA